jgi:hypothetical protein
MSCDVALEGAVALSCKELDILSAPALRSDAVHTVNDSVRCRMCSDPLRVPVR